MACPTSTYDVFFFLRSSSNPGGTGTLIDPFLIAEGSLGDSQKQIIQDGIDATYDALGLSNQLYNELTYTITLATASVEDVNVADSYQAIADIYGEVTCDTNDAVSELYSALANVIAQPSATAEIDLLTDFRDVYFSFSNNPLGGYVAAARTLNITAINRTNSSGINGFLQDFGIFVSVSWAELSGLSGYSIDNVYIL